MRELNGWVFFFLILFFLSIKLWHFSILHEIKYSPVMSIILTSRSFDKYMYKHIAYFHGSVALKYARRWIL